MSSGFGGSPFGIRWVAVAPNLRSAPSLFRIAFASGPYGKPFDSSSRLGATISSHLPMEGLFEALSRVQ